MSEEQETLNPEPGVFAYLRDHPDFFIRHPDLVTSLRIPHPCQPAVSLLEYQNRLLRERCQHLHDKLLELVNIARDNDRLSDRVQQLTLSLLDAPVEPGELPRWIKAALRDEFNADRVALCLAVASSMDPQAAAALPPCSESIARFESVWQGGQPRCVRPRPEQASALFGADAARIASAALIPLGGDQWRGLLALGSWDEGRFHPGVGTLFLGRVGELVSRVLEARRLAGQRRAASDPPRFLGGG